MKVKIISCHSKKAWYYNKIGECVNVYYLSENAFDGWYGVFDDIDFTIKNRIIKMSDCIPVNELRLKKLNRIITQYGNTT